MAGINSSKRHIFLFVFFSSHFLLVWLLWWLTDGPRSCFRKRLLWELGIVPSSLLGKPNTLPRKDGSRKICSTYVIDEVCSKVLIFFNLSGLLPEWGSYLVMNNTEKSMGPCCSVISCGIIKYCRQMGSQGLHHRWTEKPSGYLSSDICQCQNEHSGRPNTII